MAMSELSGESAFGSPRAFPHHRYYQQGSYQMVSEHLPGNMTLTDRVALLETKVDGIQSELHEGLDTMKVEIQEAMSEIRDKFESMMRKWEGQERERKEKGLARHSPEATHTSKIPQKSDEAGVSTDCRNCHEDSRRMEILAAPLPASMAGMKGNFINRLKPMIGAEVRTLKHCGLSQNMELVQQVKDHNEYLKQTHIPYLKQLLSSQNCNPHLYSYQFRFSAHPTPRVIQKSIAATMVCLTTAAREVHLFEKLTNAEPQLKRKREMPEVLVSSLQKNSVFEFSSQNKLEKMKEATTNNREEKYENGLPIRAEIERVRVVGWVLKMGRLVESKWLAIRSEIHRVKAVGLDLEMG